MNKDKMSFFCSIQKDVSHAPTNLPKSIKDKFLIAYNELWKLLSFGHTPWPLMPKQKESTRGLR